MSSQQYNGLRPFAPSSSYSTRSSSSIAPPSTAESSTTPRSTTKSSLAVGRPSSFWIQEGMDTFFDWITDPHKWARLRRERQSIVHKEICQLVNSKHSTKWTETQVKAKITYVRKKYREAAALNSTGKGVLVHRKQKEICPFFDRLHIILRGSLSTDTLPPRQTGSPPRQTDSPPRQTGSKQKEVAISNSSDEQSSDLVRDNTFETAFFTDNHYNGEHPNKRPKSEGLTPASLNSTIDRMQQFSEQERLVYTQSKSELRAREEAVEQRERDLAEKLMRMVDEANKRTEEARFQLRQELAAERADFRKEMAFERAELKQDREDLRRDREDLRRDRAQYMKEREETIKAENSSLKKELEIRFMNPRK